MKIREFFNKQFDKIDSKVKRMMQLIIGSAIFFLIIVIILGYIANAALTNAYYIQPVQGKVTPEKVDLSERMLHINGDGQWEYYPEKLYYPEDFKTGIEPSYINSLPNDADYSTCRIFIELPKDKTYGIAIKGADFSMRTFINGVEQKPLGVVGNTLKTTVPAGGYCIFYFTPKTDITEIIFQTANFVYREGGLIFPLYIGEYQHIAKMNEIRVFSICFTVGILLAVTLFLLGMFLFNGHRKSFLYFTLATFILGLRELFTGDKFITQLFPNISWYFLIATEYICLAFITITFLTYLNSIFPKIINKYVKWIVYILSFIFGGIVIISKPIFYSELLIYYEIIITVAFIYVIVHIVIKAKKSLIENILIFIGALALLISVILDILFMTTGFYIGYDNFTPLAMIFFIFMNMISMALRFYRTEEALYNVEKIKNDLKRENELLVSLDKIRTEFLGNISHEIRTPLAIMSGYAQLSNKKIDVGEAEETKPYLKKISQEAERISKMAEQLLKITQIQENGASMQRFSLASFIESIAEVYHFIIEEKGNTLIIDIATALPDVKADGTMITQLIVNLLSNSGRHTKNGTIIISAADKGNLVEITVSDTGCGISSERLKNLFTRYNVKKDDIQSTGLGLVICKEIAKAHGSEIIIISEENKGTEVKFSLPFYKEDEVA